MNLINLMNDKRNPIYFLDLLKKRKSINRSKKIYFSFTLDLEKDSTSKFNESNLDKILNFLENYGKGTFFIETSLLEKFSLNLGKNEIASHGYNHLALGDEWWIKNYEKSNDVEKNIKKSTNLIKDNLGVKPISFRSPKFSCSESLNKILFKNGYKINSSNNPHNDNFLPLLNNKLIEIPISRYYKPSLRFKYGLPYLRYNSLMFSNLKLNGLSNFQKLSKNILQSWPVNDKPLLNFMCHNWDFKSEDDFKVMGTYLDNLQKDFKIKFVSLKKYYEKFY